MKSHDRSKPHRPALHWLPYV